MQPFQGFSCLAGHITPLPNNTVCIVPPVQACVDLLSGAHCVGYAIFEPTVKCGYLTIQESQVSSSGLALLVGALWDWSIP